MNQLHSMNNWFGSSCLETTLAGGLGNNASLKNLRLLEIELMYDQIMRYCTSLKNIEKLSELKQVRIQHILHYCDAPLATGTKQQHTHTQTTISINRLQTILFPPLLAHQNTAKQDLWTWYLFGSCRTWPVIVFCISYAFPMVSLQVFTIEMSQPQRHPRNSLCNSWYVSCLPPT